MMARYPFTRNDALWEENNFNLLFWNPPNMNLMERRVETFNYWPANNPNITYDLAKDGLFYTGDRDIVRCFSCDVQIGQWKKRDSPNVRHRNESPLCPMANPQLGNTANVDFFPSLGETVSPHASLITSSSSSSGSSSGSYSGSFSGDGENCINGLETDGHTQKNQRQRNRPKSKAKSKQATHNVHAKEEFSVVPKQSVKELKKCRKTCLDQTSKTIKRDLGTKNANQVISYASRTNTTTPCSNRIYQNASRGGNKSENQVADIISNIRASGISNDHLRQALSRLLDNVMPISRDNLVNMVSEIQSGESTTRGNNVESQQDVDNQVILERQRLKFEQRKLELESVVKHAMCRICQREMARTLFLPCAHLVACAGCTESLSECPACNKVIRGTKEVFFA